MLYAFAGFSLDTAAREVSRGDKPIHLSPKALDLLIALIEQRPRAVPKRELYDRLWPSTFVVEGNLPVLIGEIRAALDDGDHQIVRTVHGTGYAFGATVRELDEKQHAEQADGFLHLLLFDGHQHRLTEGENLVGREPGANVFLPSASVSRRHAVITVRGADAILTDLDSKNGTFLGSDPVKSDLLLTDGSTVRFGEIITRYRRCTPDGATVSL